MPRRTPLVDRQWKKCDSSVGCVGQSFPPQSGFCGDKPTRWTNPPDFHDLYSAFTPQFAQANLALEYEVNSALFHAFHSPYYDYY